MMDSQLMTPAERKEAGVTVEKVGLIGLGAMGRPMSRRMIAAGHALFGYDPDAAALQRCAHEGLTPCASPAEVARQSDAVIIVVGFEAQVEAVLFGVDGILAAARPGLVVGLGSTVSPSYARALAERLKGSGVALVDMPLTRSDRAAEDGTLLVLGGAEPEVFEAFQPVLGTFATDIFLLGPFGTGQIAKMVNNMILWACMAANDEGLRFGEELGVDPERLREALSVSSAANFPLIEKSDTRPIPWAEKDMVIAQHEADKVRFSLPLAAHVKELIKAFKVRKGYATPSF